MKCRSGHGNSSRCHTTQEVKLVDSNLRGPLGHGLSALLLGRSSTFRQGIFVLPGVIDADYSGIIKIMIYTLAPPISIPAGSKIAQLVPFYSQIPHADPLKRREGGFGSTGQPQVLLALDIQKSKPEELVELKHPHGKTITFKMIIDTGTDVTIIPVSKWPKEWPLVNSNSGVFGIGGVQATFISQEVISFCFPDGATVSTSPYVLNIPIALIGRDILCQMKAKLITRPF